MGIFGSLDIEYNSLDDLFSQIKNLMTQWFHKLNYENIETIVYSEGWIQTEFYCKNCRFSFMLNMYYDENFEFKNSAHLCSIGYLFTRKCDFEFNKKLMIIS